LLEAQSRTLEWLKQRRPAYVLWNPSPPGFDGVPNAVRVPLLFRYVVAHYSPVQQIGAFQLLRRRHEREPAATEYWLRALGETIRLGYIPSLSNAESVAVSSGQVRNRYLLIRSANPIEGRNRMVRLTVAGKPLALQFFERANILQYSINMERLPWADLDTDLPTLSPLQEVGLQFSLTTLSFKKELLY